MTMIRMDHKKNSEDVILCEVIDAMATKALDSSGLAVTLAVERFSAGVDRLLRWLPESRRAEVLTSARAHGYCTHDEIERMRGEVHKRH